MAKQALKNFIHSLPEGSKFNIISFGSRFETLFEKSVEYDNTTLHKAIQDIELYDQRGKNLGGTEILKPLEYLFGLP